MTNAGEHQQERTYCFHGCGRWVLLPRGSVYICGGFLKDHTAAGHPAEAEVTHGG